MTETQCQAYIQARHDIIAGYFQNLNPRQQEGALATEGPLLLLAGAGSGKTTVLIHRIANLIRFGSGSDSDEVPEQAWRGRAWSCCSAIAATRDESLRGQARASLCRVDPPRPWEIHRHYLYQQGCQRAEGSPARRCWARRATASGP